MSLFCAPGVKQVEQADFQRSSFPLSMNISPESLSVLEVVFVFSSSSANEIEIFSNSQQKLNENITSHVIQHVQSYWLMTTQYWLHEHSVLVGHLIYISFWA